MLKGILAISGQPGLFKLVAEVKNSIIVESLLTGKRMPAYSAAKISALEEIAIFTQSGEVPLKEVFQKIKESDQVISAKASGSEMKDYFEQILPEYDKDRVYTSDIKKVIQWYSILQEKDLLKEEPEEEKKD